MSFCFILTEKYCKSSQDNYTIDLLVATCNTNIDVTKNWWRVKEKKEMMDIAVEVFILENLRVHVSSITESGMFLCFLTLY